MNAITDVDGVSVGHHQRLDDGWATGTTVVLTPSGATGGVDCRGGAPGTRETDLLRPENLVSQVHGVCLSGGSAYGLAAADGVMRWLSERQHGLPVGAEPHELVPIVPSAVIFDLPRSSWGNRPDAEFGYLACEAASGDVAEGTVGAGSGATVGSLKGGVGTASVTVDGFTVGALAVVNASGDAVDHTSGRPWAADLGDFGVEWPERAGAVPPHPAEDPHTGGPSPDQPSSARSSRLNTAGPSPDHRPSSTRSARLNTAGPSPDHRPSSTRSARLNTTIGVVATDADLTKAECQRLAMSGQDGLARAVRPAHTMFDGDTVFALATGRVEVPAEPGPIGGAVRAGVLDKLFDAAATAFSRSVVHGVLEATAAAGIVAYRDVWSGVL